MATSPFKFLDSYTKDDNDIFFGREREVGWEDFPSFRRKEDHGNVEGLKIFKLTLA